MSRIESLTTAGIHALRDETLAQLSATYTPSPGPAWATRAAHFDPTTGAYNLNARTLARVREAKARAVGGAGSLHVSVLGDSTTMQATYTDSAAVQAWPARMRDHLIRTLGLTSGGTGLMGMWEQFGGWDFSPTTSPVWPHLTWNEVSGQGELQKTGAGIYGIYGYNCVGIFSGASAPFTSVQLNPVGSQMVDEIWVYLLAAGGDILVDVTDGTTTHKFQIAGYYGKTVTPQSGYTAVACEAGYVQSSDPATAGGICVAKLVVPVQDNWTASVRSTPSGVAYLTMLEARLSTGTLRVSNLAQGGLSLSSILTANAESTGNGGMPQGIDTPGADLAIIALGLNDWQTHGSVSTFKANLTTLVARQRFVGTTGDTDTGTGAAGDALLVIQPTPDLTRLPATGGNVPPLADFWRAMYEVADEQDVALLDQSWRWTDYTTSAPMYRADDPIHGNEIGHADLGISIGSVLARI